MSPAKRRRSRIGKEQRARDRQRKEHRQFRPRVEALEDRRLLAASGFLEIPPAASQGLVRLPPYPEIHGPQSIPGSGPTLDEIMSQGPGPWLIPNSGPPGHDVTIRPYPGPSDCSCPLVRSPRFDPIFSQVPASGLISPSCKPVIHQPMGSGTLVPDKSPTAFAPPAHADVPLADGFDFPVGAPNGDGYLVKNHGEEFGLTTDRHKIHPGEDWNDLDSGDSDFGDAVHSVANGIVVASGDYGAGWGQIVLIRHDFPNAPSVWSQYAHLDSRKVSVGEIVHRCDRIGEIGKGHEREYLAHLHFEIRKIDIPANAYPQVGENLADILQRYYSPTEFINAHRPDELLKGTQSNAPLRSVASPVSERSAFGPVTIRGFPWFSGKQIEFKFNALHSQLEIVTGSLDAGQLRVFLNDEPGRYSSEVASKVAASETGWMSLRENGFRQRSPGSNSWIRNVRPGDSFWLGVRQTDVTGKVLGTKLTPFNHPREALPTPYHNARQPLDADNDGHVYAKDALVIVNHLNRLATAGSTPPSTEAIDFYYDTNADTFVTPLDLLLVINHLNKSQAASSGQETQQAEINLLTAAQLRALMPHASEQRIGEVVPALNGTMKEFQVNTIERKAAFLAQLAHESGELRYMEEWASGWAYEGRADLGNVQRGDGPRYKGRGPLQLTGRANYRAAGNALGLDLENDPALAANPATGMRIAGWFWDSRNLNTLADQGDFQGITRRINGGLNGWENRLGYYQRALEILREPSAARELAGPWDPDDSTIENKWSGHLKPNWFWRDRFLLGRFWKLWGV